ncbi:hypothetical protein N6H14_14930 [Paenibacillus sp. CC-CFT747]|nr:hypothetical protein N6H14_14930 [Paenibacillus sp. CC-CFT747]
MVGQKTKVNLLGTLGDGFVYNLPQIPSAALQFASLAPGTAVIDASGVITALQPGSASFKAAVTLEGVTLEKACL